MKAERSANTIFFFVRGSEKRTRANLEAHLSTICFARFHHCGKCYAHLGAYIYCKQAVKHTCLLNGPCPKVHTRILANSMTSILRYHKEKNDHLEGVQ